MHVLITADTVGGVWTYTRELVCGLLDRGHRVTLVSFGKMPSAAQTAWLRNRDLTYHPTRFPLEWMQSVETGIAESVQHLARIVKYSRPDVLHLSQFCYGDLDVDIPRVLVAHSDVLTWWNGVHESDPPSTPWLTWYTKLVRRGLECADAVVAPSQWMLDTLQQHYNLPKRGYVIFNGRSVQLFRPSRSKTDCVLSVGRVWDEAKQMTLLLARDHCVPVGIAGSIEHPDKSRASWLRLQSHGNFKFWGEQNESELRVLYSGASTYAATSRYEPFGLAPVEAALSRCALIANDIPVFHELWGDSALYFKQNDADSLAEAIRILSGNAALRELFADRAYECARERYDASRMVAEYEQLYGRLCGKGASA